MTNDAPRRPDAPQTARHRLHRPLLFRVIALSLTLLLGAGTGLGLSGCNRSRASVVDQASVAEVLANVDSSPAALGRLGFSLTSESWDPAWGDLVVALYSVSGETEASPAYYQAAINQVYSLESAPGTYRLSLNGQELVHEDHVFKAQDQTFTFDGSKDILVSLPIELDEAATQQRIAEREAANSEAQAQEEADAQQPQAEEETQRQAEEAAQAEAEAQRQAEEEAARLQAEAEAAAQAEAEARAQAEAAAQAEAESFTPEEVQTSETQAQPDSRTVYITNTGEKYHEEDCRHLSQSKIPIALDDALARGYSACKVCH